MTYRNPMFFPEMPLDIPRTIRVEREGLDVALAPSKAEATNPTRLLRVLEAKPESLLPPPSFSCILPFDRRRKYERVRTSPPMERDLLDFARGGRGTVVDIPGCRPRISSRCYRR